MRSLLVLAVLIACVAAPAGGTCPDYLDGVVVGVPQSPALPEISGLAASCTQADVFWTHNDSGDGPYVYAMSSAGAHLGRWELAGVAAIDWEDIAIGPGPVPGVDYLYIGDVGDNAHARLWVTVYRVPEPVVPLDGVPATETISTFDTLDIQYPLMTAYNCETLLVDPLNADLYLVTKDSQYTFGESRVFHYPAPQYPGTTEIVSLVASLPSAADTFAHLITAGDVAADGSAVLLRSYSYARWWPRDTGVALWEAFAETPCAVPAADEIQGEAIAFAPQGFDYYTASEESVLNEPQPLYYYEYYETEGEGNPACENSRGGFYEAGDELCLRIPEALEPGPPYQWMRDGIYLTSDGRITGALSRSLNITMLEPADSGMYMCRYRDAAKTDQIFGPVSVVVADAVPAVAGGGMLVLVMALVMYFHRRGKK